MTKNTTNQKGINMKKTPMDRMEEKVEKLSKEVINLRSNFTHNIKQGMNTQYKEFDEDVAELRKTVRLDIFKKAVLTGIEWITRGRPEHAMVSITAIKAIDLPDAWWEEHQHGVQPTLAKWVLIFAELAKTFAKEEKTRTKNLKSDVLQEMRKKTLKKK